MRPSLNIRSYTPLEIELIMDIFMNAVHKTASKDYNAAQITAWGQIDKYKWIKRCTTRPIWIAEVDGVAAGFTDLEDNGHLDMMFVHSSFNKMGVATLLLKTAEDHAAELKLPRIFTEASLTAKPFFERRGFHLMIQQEVEIRGQILTNFKMEKFLY
ncbi:GNAT family N-acetyltransferase [Pedobacter sp. ISL-68]|uniref:GNAT family N-acetyltransferase n=1 Tax=unclassified Pedobacter TaxID=2628915 RepID=UPI001BE9B50B|nr:MULTISPECIES: GNAT family N-acetyltransferase [unclassified Pedobacter]MBT2564687.1 GNAT family N-acetyltransferase [Pedobacter sp. ISL-64]MBT2592424.1 GNAT family N-acetyltransferase [Pedobacter sp. ISL-68]